MICVYQHHARKCVSFPRPSPPRAPHAARFSTGFLQRQLRTAEYFVESLHFTIRGLEYRVESLEDTVDALVVDREDTANVVSGLQVDLAAAYEEVRCLKHEVQTYGVDLLFFYFIIRYAFHPCSAPLWLYCCSRIHLGALVGRWVGTSAVATN